MKYIKLNRSNLVAIVDDEDFEKCNIQNWYVNKGYAMKGRQDKVTKKIHSHFLHWDILPKKDGYEIDHINRNRLDNRKENLRYATRSQNQSNKVFKNKSGYRGVYETKGRWNAKIRNNMRHIYLGYFNTPQEAAVAYDKAAKEIHGDFAVLNFQ